MRARLTILIEKDVQLVEAYIFTLGQGICLDKRSAPFHESQIVFKRGLAYGSWYDVLVRVRSSDRLEKPDAYMKKRIYLSVGQCKNLSDVMTPENCVNSGQEWQCKHSKCQKWNEVDINMCLHCYRNKASKIINGLSFIPVLGLPFSITNAVLESGRAAQTRQPEDVANAIVVTGAAVIDIVLTPLFVASFIKIPAMAAAKTGTQLTVKTAFSETGQIAGKAALKKVTTIIGSRTAGVTACQVIADGVWCTKKEPRGLVSDSDS